MLATGVALGSDVCSEVSIAYADDVIDQCGNTETIYRTWTATDDCDHATSCVQTITVIDTTPPVITCPEDEVLECDGAGNMAEIASWLAEIDGSDTCGEVTLTHDYTGLSDDCGATGAATVTFTATDECSNSSTCVATVTVVDTTDPAIDTEASDETVECDGGGNVDELNAWLASNGGAAASDICGDVRWENNFTALSDDCGATGAATVTFTAIDECDNESLTTATFTIEDTTAPEIVTCPPAVTFECDGAQNVPEINGWRALFAASDVCSGVAVTLTDDYTGLTPDCGATGSATVTFTATDDCGLTTTCVSTVTVVDTTPPEITCPDDVTLECPADLSVGANGSATGSDICSGTDVTVSSVDEVEFCAGTETVWRTWTVRDDCGNTSQCVQTITEVDTTDPVALCNDVLLPLDADGKASLPISVVDAGSSDTCSDVALSLSKQQFDCGDVGANSVVLTVEDAAGNVSTCEATVTVVDEAAPVVTCQDITVQLLHDGTASIEPEDVDDGSWDNCGIDTMVVVPDAFDCSDVGENLVVLTITDVNGNVNLCQATVTVEDNVAPDAACQDITVELDADGAATITADQIDDGSWDACGIESITVAPSEFDCGDTGANTVVLTVTDVNANVSTCAATVTVEDNIDPEITCPADVTLECVADTSVEANGEAEASDNCPGVAVTSSDDVTDECGGTKRIARTWTATDASANSVTCVQTITVVDTTLPDITCPASVTLECPADTTPADTGLGDGRGCLRRGDGDACGRRDGRLRPDGLDRADLDGDGRVRPEQHLCADDRGGRHDGSGDQLSGGRDGGMPDRYQPGGDRFGDGGRSLR